MDIPHLATETWGQARDAQQQFETAMTTSEIRFGVWAPVHGPRAALDDPAEPFDASWAHNKRVVLEAEALGYDSTLIAQHTVNPHLPKHDQLETWTAAAALAALTSRIEIIAAIKPFIYHPIGDDSVRVDGSPICDALGYEESGQCPTQHCASIETDQTLA